MKRFLLPLILLVILILAFAGIGFVAVKYAIDYANRPRPFTYDELVQMHEKDKVEEKDLPRLLLCFEGDEDQRIKAAETLARAGAAAIEPLRGKLKDGNPRIRFCAVQTLAFMDPKDSAAATDDLVVCLEDTDADVRRKAVYVLGRGDFKDDAVFAKWIKVLDDPEPAVVETAMEILKKMQAPPQAALPALTKLARDPKFEVRSEAIDLLGKSGAAAVPVFKELLVKADAVDRAAVIRAASRLGAEAKPLLPELQAIMKANPWWDNDAEIFAIFKACGPDGAAGLESVLRSVYEPKSLHFTNADDKARAILPAIGQIGPRAKNVTPTLVDLLKDRPALRPVVLETLGDIGPGAKEAIPAVEALTNDPAAGNAARVALRRMGVVAKK